MIFLLFLYSNTYVLRSNKTYNQAEESKCRLKSRMIKLKNIADGKFGNIYIIHRGQMR